MAYASFEDLEVWKKSCRLAVRVYKALEGCRDFGLKDQMTRAAVSIASNIAEGCERNSAKDFARFLHIAKGSSAELRTQTYIAGRVRLLEEQEQAEIIEELKSISRMLHKLAESLKPEPLKPEPLKPKTENLKPKTENLKPKSVSL